MSLEIIDRLLPDGVSRIGERPVREVSAALQFWRVEYKTAGEMELAVVTWEGLHDNWGKIEQRIDELQSAAIPGVRMPTGYWYEGRTAIFLLPNVGTPIPEVAPATYTEQELEKIRTQLTTICGRLAQENICHEGIVVDALFWDAGNKEVSLEGAPWAILASISQGACMPYDLSLVEPPEWNGKIRAGTPESDQYALGMALAYIAAGKRHAQQLACDLHGDDEAASEKVLLELKEQLQGHTCPAILRTAIPTLLDRDPASRGKSGVGGDRTKIPWPAIITLCLCVLILAIGFAIVKGPEGPEVPGGGVGGIVGGTGDDAGGGTGDDAGGDAGGDEGGTGGGEIDAPLSPRAVWRKVISGIKKRHKDKLPVFGDFVVAANREVSDFKPKDREKAQTVLRVIRQWHSGFRKGRIGQWLEESDTDRQVKAEIQKKLRQCYEDPFTKKEGPAFNLARYLTGINKAVDLWRKLAEEDIPFSVFKKKGESLRGAIANYPNGFPEGESLFIRWCNEIENLEAARVYLLKGTCTGSEETDREIQFDIGGEDYLIEEEHKWIRKGKQLECNYSMRLEDGIEVTWKPDDEIHFKLEEDNLFGDPNLFDVTFVGPVSLWKLRVSGLIQSEDKKTRITLRVTGCPGPPNSLSKTDTSIVSEEFSF